MNAYQKAKLLMVKGLIQFCDENAVIIAGLTAFQNALIALKAKVAEIEDTGQLMFASLAGIAADKGNLKQTICQLGADISGMIYAYASENSNNTLKQEVNFSISKLQRTRETEIALVCQMIHGKGTENLTELTNYGVTTGMLTDFQNAIDNYSAAMPKPRTAIGKRKTSKEHLKQLFKELDDILKERMDNLMGKFRASNPEFYETYFNLREIPDPHTTTTQLKGVVTGKTSGAPVKDATITVVGLAKTAKTDSKGEYSIKPIEYGKYLVRFTAAGYADFEAEEVEVKLGDIKHLDVSLTGN